MSKTLLIHTTADATVSETWTYEVADDFELPTEDDEKTDFANEVLHDGTWDGQPIPATFKGVENDQVDGEENRRVTDAEILDDAPTDDCKVTVALDYSSGVEHVGQVEVQDEGFDDDMDPDDPEDRKEVAARMAAVAWKSLMQHGIYTIAGHTFTASQCAEWWA